MNKRPGGTTSCAIVMWQGRERRSPAAHFCEWLVNDGLREVTPVLRYTSNQLQQDHAWLLPTFAAQTDLFGAESSYTIVTQSQHKLARPVYPSNLLPGNPFESQGIEMAVVVIHTTDVYLYNYKPLRAWMGKHVDIAPDLDVSTFVTSMGFEFSCNANWPSIWEGQAHLLRPQKKIAPSGEASISLYVVDGCPIPDHDGS